MALAHGHTAVRRGNIARGICRDERVKGKVYRGTRCRRGKVLIWQRGNNMQTQIVFQFEPGFSGIDGDVANPLSRALNTLLDEGRPVQHLALCFFGGVAEARDQTTGPRWLGAFVVSDGGRIIFFPGFNGVWLQRQHGHAIDFRKFDVDHFSLNSDFAAWHATSRKSKDHQDVGATMSLGEGRYLWMAMSVADETVLRKVRRETAVTAETPPSDSARRASVFQTAIDQAQHLWVSLDADARPRFPEGFPHFAMIIGPKGFADEKVRLNFPLGPPSLKAPLGDIGGGLLLRIARLPLGPNVDLEIVSAWLPGVLQAPVIFTIG